MKKNISKGIIYVLVATALILLIPFITMQFTNEVKWTISDFIVAGMLLLVTGLIFIFSTDHMINIRYKVAVGIFLLLILAYIWAELAVGIFTNWGS